MRRGRIALIVSAVGGVLPTLGFAQTSNWTFNGGGSAWTQSWQNNNNWNPNSAFPNGSNATANFPAAAIGGGSGTVLINSGLGVTVNRVNFVGTGTNSNGYTIGGTSTLTIVGDGTIDVSAASGPNVAVATLSGLLTVPSSGTVNKTGNGTLVLNGNTSSSGLSVLAINGGTVRVASSNAIAGFSFIGTSGTGQLELSNASSSGTIFFGLGSTPANGHGTLYNSAGNNTWSGNWFITSAGETADIAGGTKLTLNGSVNDGQNSSTNGFTKSGTGTLAATVSLNGILHVAGGTLVLPQSSQNTMIDLDITGGASPVARLDVTNAKAVIHSNVSAKIKSELQTGYDGGAWDGNGITSSIAEADAAINNGHTNLAVGYARGDQLSNFNGSTASFGGSTLAASDVAVTLTVVGDTNLDGVVDVNNDLAHFVSGYSAPHSFLSNTDWFNGDFNYDGNVDLNKDFTKFAGSFIAQGGTANALNNAIDNSGLPSGDKQTMHNIVATVPEPGIALVGIAGGLLINRRRRK